MLSVRKQISRQGLLLLFLISWKFSAVAQSESEWSNKERVCYHTLYAFTSFLKRNSEAIFNRDSLMQYVEFTYVLNDSSSKRVLLRTNALDTLVLKFKSYIDSVGVDNLAAVPLKFYKSDQKVFKDIQQQLANQVDNIFVYYIRKEAEPEGYILFDPQSHKMISWILINEDGKLYFLTFNLL